MEYGTMGLMEKALIIFWEFLPVTCVLLVALEFRVFEPGPGRCRSPCPS
jgi:hypothetical protein